MKCLMLALFVAVLIPVLALAGWTDGNTVTAAAGSNIITISTSPKNLSIKNTGTNQLTFKLCYDVGGTPTPRGGGVPVAAGDAITVDGLKDYRPNVTAFEVTSTGTITYNWAVW